MSQLMYALSANIYTLFLEQYRYHLQVDEGQNLTRWALFVILLVTLLYLQFNAFAFYITAWNDSLTNKLLTKDQYR